MNRLRLQESLAEGAPIQRAREHGNLAEQLMAAGKWVEAREHHRSAANEYQACLKFTQNTGLQTTLRMLYADHSKAARDIQRKIEENDLRPKSRSNGKDRALPPLPAGGTFLQPAYSSPVRSAAERRSTSRQHDANQRNHPPAPPSDDQSSPHPAPSHQPVEDSPIQSSSGSPASSRLLQDSQTTERMADGSYMVLNGSQTEPQDSFSIFFRAIEGMLDKFSQPVPIGVAFASAPLVPTLSPKAQTSSSPTPREATPDESDHVDDSSDSDSSFFMIPSSTTSSTRSISDSPLTQYPPPLFQSGVATARSSEVRPSLQTLQAENERLQALLSELTAKLSNAQEIIRLKEEQEQAVRDSVMIVRREAQRAMAASTTLGRNSSVFAHMPQSLQASLMGPAYFPTPPSSHTRPSSPEKVVTPAVPILDPALDMTTLRRIKELEFQLQTLKSDNENQRSQITRYRERWQKLKETAKRKQRSSKDSNGNVVVPSGPPEKIVEEDEGTKSDTTLGGDHTNGPQET